MSSAETCTPLFAAQCAGIAATANEKVLPGLALIGEQRSQLPNDVDSLLNPTDDQVQVSANYTHTTNEASNFLETLEGTGIRCGSCPLREVEVRLKEYLSFDD